MCPHRDIIIMSAKTNEILQSIHCYMAEWILKALDIPKGINDLPGRGAETYDWQVDDALS